MLIDPLESYYLSLVFHVDLERGNHLKEADTQLYPPCYICLALPSYNQYIYYTQGAGLRWNWVENEGKQLSCWDGCLEFMILGVK